MAKESLEIRLTDEQVANLHKVAKLAGCKIDTVISVLLALFVLKHPEHTTGPHKGGD